MNTYLVSRSPNDRDWTELGQFQGRSQREDLLVARKRDRSADCYWRVKTIAAYKMLGRTRTFEFDKAAT